MRYRVISVLFVLPILVLSACGGGDDDESMKPVESTKPSASVTPSETASLVPTDVPLPTTTPEAAKIAVSVLGANVADTADEQAVVDAWMTYWKAVSATYSEREPSPGLDSARGEPLIQVLDYLDTLKAKDRRVMGWSRENVLAVTVDGNDASLRSCSENFTFEVDSTGNPLEEVKPFYLASALLEKDGDRWVIASIRSEESATDCRS